VRSHDGGLRLFRYILLTVWLVQRYSTPDSSRWARAGGRRTTVFSNSLGLVMGGIFLRQRGSPESKPVGAPHVTTDETG
jgi:uncharacterized protein DUF6766